MGSLLALWLVRTRPDLPLRGVNELASLAGIGLIALAVLTFDEETVFPGIAATVPVTGTALVVWANANGRTMSGKILAWRPIVFFGLISYSLYLWHWPLLVFAA